MTENKKYNLSDTGQRIGAKENAHLDKDPDTNLFISTYTEEDRERAVQAMLITGSITKVSQITKIPARTLKEWKKSQWWEEKFSEARDRYRKQLDGKFNAMFGYITKQLEERLRKGDEVVLKDGRKVYKQIPAKELASIADTIWKILALVRGEPTSRTEKVEVKDKLNAIQEELAERTRKKKEEEKGSVIH